MRESENATYFRPPSSVRCQQMTPTQSRRLQAPRQSTCHSGLGVPVANDRWTTPRKGAWWAGNFLDLQHVQSAFHARSTPHASAALNRDMRCWPGASLGVVRAQSGSTPLVVLAWYDMPHVTLARPPAFVNRDCGPPLPPLATFGAGPNALDVHRVGNSIVLQPDSEGSGAASPDHHHSPGIYRKRLSV